MASQFPVSQLCQALDVSRSGYYAHKKKPQRLRRRQDESLKASMHQAFQESGSTYGTPRLVKAAQQQGLPCGRNRMGRLMKEEAIRPIQKRKYRPQTTDSTHAHPVAPNWLKHIPVPEAPDQVWVADITYVETREGWLYLAGIMDLYSRRIVGWTAGETMESQLVEKALDKAVGRRRPGQGLIHHSDRGSQYASHSFRQLLATARITASMSRRGNCYDNAHKESFWGTLKTECFGKGVPATRKEAELQIFRYIEGFYNTRRYHSSLGYRSPAQYESDYLRSLADRRARAVSGTTSAGGATSLFL